eukprot:3916503-Prorocentrum_lima.AAC.1
MREQHDLWQGLLAFAPASHFLAGVHWPCIQLACITKGVLQRAFGADVAEICVARSGRRKNTCT